MEGDSEGHTEGIPSADMCGRSGGRRLAGDRAKRASKASGAKDPRDAIAKGVGDGLLNASQAKALADLVSRMAVLGFEAGRVISDMVHGIASERSEQRRKELVLRLTEYLEGDGLARDLIPPISESFSPR